MNFARIWCITNPNPARPVTPPWNVYMATFDPGLPVLAGHPTHHVNVIKLKWEIIWTGGLHHLRELPPLPVVPHLHVNRPLNSLFFVARAEFQVGVDSVQSCFGGKSSAVEDLQPLVESTVIVCLLFWPSFAFTKIALDSPIIIIKTLFHLRWIKKN